MPQFELFNCLCVVCVIYLSCFFFPERMPYTHHSPSHSSHLVDAIVNTYSQRLFPDVTLVIDHLRIPCHRFILASMCPYFYTMFTSGMRETSDKEIVLQGMDSRVVERVVEYLYTGSVQITADLAQGLLQAADMYNLQDLRNGCINFYSDNITCDTCLAIWKLGTDLGDKYLSQAAFQVAADHFEYIVEHLEDFLELSVEDLSRYLVCENLRVESEERVFDAALKWLGANPKCASQFYKVVSRINLTNIDPRVLDKKYLTKKDIYVDKHVTQLIQAAINHQLRNDELPYAMNEQTVRNYGNQQQKLLILGGSQQMLSQHFSVYSCQVLTSDGTTEVVRDLPYILPSRSGTSYLASCFVHGVLYVSGLGEGNDEVWCYYEDKILWKQGPNLQTGRWNHEMVVGPEFKIYVLGGYCSLRSVASIDELNTSLEKISKWKTVGCLCEAIGSFSALYHGNAIYTFGGQQNFNDDMDIIQQFNLLTNTCSILEVKLPVTSGSSRITTWGCYAILVSATATIVINLETLDKLTTDAAGKLCIKYDMQQNPVFRVGPGVGLHGFSMNRLGQRIYIAGGELVRGSRGTGTYSKAVIKGQIKDVLQCRDGSNGFINIQNVQLNEPLAYHTAVAVRTNKGSGEPVTKW